MKRIFLALAVMIGVFFFSAAVPLPAYAADESCDATVFGNYEIGRASCRERV